MTKPEEAHYFAFNLEGFAAYKGLGECIDHQLRNNGGCYAVMRVHAPIKATYSIARFLPYKFYEDSAFNPGEPVYFTPVAAPHKEVAKDYRAGCTDTTDWAVEQWREYANGILAFEDGEDPLSTNNDTLNIDI